MFDELELPSPEEWQNTQQQGLAIQNRELRFALQYIREQYIFAQQALNDPELLDDFKRIIVPQTLQFITNLNSIALSEFKLIGQEVDAENTLALIIFKSTVSAYKLLLNKENPDDWLGQFLDTFPEFREDIGGYPNWLKRPTQTP